MTAADVATLKTDAACAAVGTANEAIAKSADDAIAIKRILGVENLFLNDISFPPSMHINGLTRVFLQARAASLKLRGMPV